MEQQRKTVIDPMFVGRYNRQRVPSYTQRSTQYMSTARRPVESFRTPIAVTATRDHDPSMARPTPRHRAPEPRQAGQEEAGSPDRPATRHILSRFQSLIPNRQATLLYSMAGLVFLVGLLVSINGMRANRQVAAQVKHAQQQTVAAVSNGSTNATPSATKPTPAMIKQYKVSPNIPRYISIPTLHVHARVFSEGVTPRGQLQVPWDIYDTGWYNASSQPGQMGAMLIDGHSGIGNMHGIFYKISTLKKGAAITVTRGDGKQFTYKVVTVKVLNVKKVNMSDLLVSADTNKPGLNLITCAGERIPGTEELNERAEVYAVLQ